MKPLFSFVCTQCGNCCSEEGYVFFSEEEIRLCSEKTGLSVEEFRKRYLIKVYGKMAHEVKYKHKCVFLKNNKCIIQEAKPKQCKTFPFWDEYIGLKGELINFDRPCKGIFSYNKDEEK